MRRQKIRKVSLGLPIILFEPVAAELDGAHDVVASARVRTWGANQVLTSDPGQRCCRPFAAGTRSAIPTKYRMTNKAKPKSNVHSDNTHLTSFLAGEFSWNFPGIAQSRQRNTRHNIKIHTAPAPSALVDRAQTSTVEDIPALGTQSGFPLQNIEGVVKPDREGIGDKNRQINVFLLSTNGRRLGSRFFRRALNVGWCIERRRVALSFGLPRRGALEPRENYGSIARSLLPRDYDRSIVETSQLGLSCFLFLSPSHNS